MIPSTGWLRLGHACPEIRSDKSGHPGYAYVAVPNMPPRGLCAGKNALRYVRYFTVIRRLEVALLGESSRVYGRNALQGIAAYAKAHGPWLIHHHGQILGNTVPPWLRKWKGDGIIARIESRRLYGKLQRLDVPIVDVRCRYDFEGVPAIGGDNLAVGRMATEHLLEREFQHYAYCGFAGVNYSEMRRRHFSECLAERGFSLKTWEDSAAHGEAATPTIEMQGLKHDAGMRSWVKSLPKPVGIFASNDVRAQQVLNACGFCGIAVPDEVAVLGVDNDEVICDLCCPPLSSIELNTRKIGYEAAALLDRLMHGATRPDANLYIPPIGVVARDSTDAVAIPNGATASAVPFIRQCAVRGITVADVLEHAGCSRSTLERRFVKYLGRTPGEEILRVQLQRVKHLLVSTDYPLARIAQLAGFNYVGHMCNLFKRKMNQTAGQYRREMKAKAGS